MYQNDAEVERDVEMLRRRLREEPVDKQARLRTHTTALVYGEDKTTWWVVSVPGRVPDSNWVWFAFDRNAEGKLEVRERVNKVEILAEVDTVEAAMMAGMVAIERPS